MLLKPAAQMTEMVNSSMRSSRLVLPQMLSYGFWSLPLICFHESHLSL
jgi:hypothetical protein